MEPVFIGSHPAVDFLNTSLTPNGEQIEVIGDGRSFFAWLVAAKLIDDGQTGKLLRRMGVKGADAAAAQARHLREWARSWLERWRSAPDRDYSLEFEKLNKYLAMEVSRREIVRTDQGIELTTRSQVESADELLALLAFQIATLITQEDASLLKSCSGSGCTLWFLDRTKAHRRLFCSTATCGNRAKVAAFRDRQRE
jgi:predicted RNA-binding Zn ribbon-like protein